MEIYAKMRSSSHIVASMFTNASSNATLTKCPTLEKTISCALLKQPNLSCPDLEQVQRQVQLLLCCRLSFCMGHRLRLAG